MGPAFSSSLLKFATNSLDENRHIKRRYVMETRAQNGEGTE
jgi:hypothetical protein